jgi:serine O-acetyltransferase
MGLASTIAEDFRTQQEGVLSQGFWALLVYRLSYPRLECRIPIVRQVWYLFNRMAGKFIEMTTGIMLPESACIGRRLRIEHFGAIIIHGATVIGDDCVIRQGVTTGVKDTSDIKAAPRIGNHVDIGAGAKIVGKLVVGDHVAIGANAVVTRDVPPMSIAVGVPATIKPRSAPSSC